MAPAPKTVFAPLLRDTVVRIILVALGIMLIGGSAARAQREAVLPADAAGGAFDPASDAPTEVPRGSDLRKTLFDTLRPRVEEQAGTKILFEGRLKTCRNWAFFLGRTIGADGRKVALSDLGNDDAVALWLRTRDGWTLVDFDAGGSDAFYTEWSRQYGAPAALFLQQ